jgi:hydroxymethylbilane synthase
MTRLVFATRKSKLALAQSRAFGEKLRASCTGLALEELLVVTSGDTIQDRPLSEVGGKGLFVKEIEEALLEKRADFAVHSIKDVPYALPDGLVIACVPKREDPRDVLVSPKHGTVAALPAGAKVGTSSLRRAVLLKKARPDVEVVPLRGNVDTRLAKVDRGEVDAILLARAGLVRLGLEARATEVIDPGLILPAIGQGALGIESRVADEDTRKILSALNDVETATCVAAERGVMVALEGDCKTPIAAHARIRGDALELTAFASEPDGTRVRTGTRSIAYPTDEGAARALGIALGNELALETRP